VLMNITCYHPQENSQKVQLFFVSLHLSNFIFDQEAFINLSL